MLLAYFTWLKKVVTGDLGTSTRYYDPVWLMIRDRIPISLYFGLITMVMIYGLCIPFGHCQGRAPQIRFRQCIFRGAVRGIRIPGWVLGVLLLILFASKWELFPLGGFVGDMFELYGFWGKAGDLLWHTVLPLCAYVAGAFTVMTFLMKNSLMDNLAADYVRTAIAKGLPFQVGLFSIMP